MQTVASSGIGCHPGRTILAWWVERRNAISVAKGLQVRDVETVTGQF